MSTPIKIPVYARIVILLIGIYVLGSILYLGQELITPFVFAFIVAVAISPIVNFMVRKKIALAISISIVMLVFIIVFFALILLIASQAGALGDALPNLIGKLNHSIEQSIIWSSGYFNISTAKLNGWLTNFQNEIINNSNFVIGSTLSTMSGILATVFLTPVYIFMLLYYQEHLLKFTHVIFGIRNDERVSELLTETKVIIQSYLAGIGLEFAMVAVLNSLGLLLLGIDYAILLGILGALLNIIPYVGGIIGVAIYILIAFVTKAPIYALYVAVMYSLIQFIDNNYFVPKMIGEKVKLNALISFIAVIVGEALWGIPGMFLSIPITAIIKLICDRIGTLEPIGYLFGDGESDFTKIEYNLTPKGFFQRIRSKIKFFN